MRGVIQITVLEPRLPLLQEGTDALRAVRSAGMGSDAERLLAKRCLEVNELALDEIDLVICGGIARNYFEPATAMEITKRSVPSSSTARSIL